MNNVSFCSHFRHPLNFEYHGHKYKVEKSKAIIITSILAGVFTMGIGGIALFYLFSAKAKSDQIKEIDRRLQTVFRNSTELQIPTSKLHSRPLESRSSSESNTSQNSDQKDQAPAEQTHSMQEGEEDDQAVSDSSCKNLEQAHNDDFQLEERYLKLLLTSSGEEQPIRTSRENDSDEELKIEGLLPEDESTGLENWEALSEEFKLGLEKYAHPLESLAEMDSAAIFEEYREVSKLTDNDGFYEAIPGKPVEGLDQLNRYTNIKPYDNTLVELAPHWVPRKNDNRYINASWIALPDVNRKYIATQAPTAITGSSFWQMVFEYNAEHIVMLTSENPAIKNGYRYWPARVGGSVVFGGYKITLEKEKSKCLNESSDEDNVFHIVHRRFLLENEDGIQRRVYHHQIPDWPDFGVIPQEAFLNALNDNRKKLKTSTSEAPLIVHCTAGVGRAGTYIAADYHLHLLEENDEDAINLAQTMTQLRTQRMLMIQAPEQYELILQTIAAAKADAL